MANNSPKSSAGTFWRAFTGSCRRCRNLHLDRVWAQCERELELAEAKLISTKADLFEELRSLRRDVASGFPRVIDEEQRRPEDHRPHSLVRFDAYMGGAGRRPNEIDEEANHFGSAHGAEILSVVLRRYVPDDRPPGDPLGECRRPRRSEEI